MAENEWAIDKPILALVVPFVNVNGQQNRVLPHVNAAARSPPQGMPDAPAPNGPAGCRIYFQPGESTLEMLCAYIDDAGNTGKNLSDVTQPIHYVGALIVPEEQWTGVTNDLKAIRKEARQCGYKGKVLEFHGTEVFQGRKGSGWEAVKFSERLRLYESCLEIIPARDLWILMGCCDKLKLGARYSMPEHPHAIAMWLCLERIAKYANSNGALTMMVADDCSEGVKGISRKVLADYRARGAPFGMTLDFSNLIDTIHFMNSAESAHIQLCDMALFAIRRFEATKDKKIQSLANAALARVRDRGTIPY